MAKPVLIVCSDPDICGALDRSREFVDQYVYGIISGKYSKKKIREIVEIIRRAEITTLLTRGLWLSYLLECEELRNMPFLSIKQLQIDSRIFLDQLSDMAAQGYRRIGLMVHQHKSAYDCPTNPGVRVHRMADFSVYSLFVFPNMDVQAVVLQFIEENQIDILFGDVEEVEVPIPKRRNIMRGKILNSLIMNAVDYDKIVKNEQRYLRFYKSLSAALNTVTEDILLFHGKDGSIFMPNTRALLKFNLSPTAPGRIQDVLHISLEEILARKKNTLVRLYGKPYLLNVMEMHTEAEQDLFIAIINSGKEIESVELSLRQQCSENGLVSKSVFSMIVCSDPLTMRTLDIARKYAQSPGTILICGETGVGKEIYANSIHSGSQRATKPFVAINCATFNETLIESELFGYCKGAFTGALPGGKKGLFEVAHKGTLFLDEIGDLPLNMQAKLLRVLQEHEIRRIGGQENIKIDVRIIAATNRPLKELVEEKKFRQDLYYRLSLLELYIPSLRERPLDIVPLFKYFIQKSANEMKKHFYWTDDAVFQPLLGNNWPGNVRELENYAMRTVLLSDEGELTRDAILNAMHATDSLRDASQDNIISEIGCFKIEATPDLNALEKQYIQYLLKTFQNDKERVCNYLHISKPTLWRKLNA